MREAEVEPAAVQLERRAQVLVRHRRALDVPAGPAPAPRRLPPRVLLRLVRLPEREVPLLLLQVARLLRDHVVELGAGEPPVLRERGNAEVDVAAGLVGEPALDQLLDQRDDLRQVLGRERLHIGPAETEIVGVLEVPLRRPAGQLVARDPLRRRGFIDLVVDVRNVLDQLDPVVLVLEPALQPHRDDERPRVADVDPLVDGRAADVHADRSGRRRERLLLARERIVEQDRHGTA